MANINLDTLLDQDEGRALVKKYIDKKFLPGRDWNGVLANSAYGVLRPIPTHDGQYIRFTRKGRARRPEHMASPGGAGSDPLSPALLTVTKREFPIEWIHEYFEVATVAEKTSWIDLDQWIKEDGPLALKRRMHELTQNAFLVGRMKPGKYDASGNPSTPFDQEAEATVTLYGVEFTFPSAPIYYAGGVSAFTDLDANSRITWTDIRRAKVRLGNAGAPSINGGLVCVLSEAMWTDLLMDDDNGRLTAAIAGGLKSAIKGLENQQVFHYAGVNFVIDDQPFTENLGADNEGKRANFGPVHSAIMFGANAFGYIPLGGKMSLKPRMTVKDLTKTGYAKTIGYLIPWQVALVEPDWACVIKAVVSESKPNNYDPSDPTKQLDNFGV